MSSPAERYARSRAWAKTPKLTEFRQELEFELDDFQVSACTELENGHSVLVAAPTGSGKTIVGEFAVFLARAGGGKCFYTTPIKALSNQKYHDLVERYGADSVGLLTGDNSINSDAPIVVMTTEVLRNMIYAGSQTLLGLRYVVMDEVHYLADQFRGAVWEEVIIHLPESVSMVSLSATVSNAEEFGDWLNEVRGNNVTIVEERRPVPLYQHVMVGRRLLPLFVDDHLVNPELERIARQDWQLTRLRNAPGKGRKGGYGRSQHNARYFTPMRRDVVEKLDAEALLPVIYFIFSRAGCDAAVEQCLNSNLVLTTEEERAEIRRFTQNEVAAIPSEDLRLLEYPTFLAGLERGFAAHHAGMLPAFKEIVEHLFSRGLVQCVFATETLALGINMPARSVVIEKMTKWNGETHTDLTAGEYTQLTGRAGRRGIDVEGHGVVLWQNGLDPKAVGGLASTRTYPLKSSFQPTYNMAVNLVERVGFTHARELLEQSFAQFQADRAVVGLARQVQRGEEALAGYADAAKCDLGDFLEFQSLRLELSKLEQTAAKRRKDAARAQVEDSLRELKVGDVIWVQRGKYAGLAVVLEPIGPITNEPRFLALTLNRQARRLGLLDFTQPVTIAGTIRIPKKFNHRSPQARRDLASALGTYADKANYAKENTKVKIDDPQINQTKAKLAAHPCNSCPDREDHARWAERYFKLKHEVDGQRAKIELRTNTVARIFDRVVAVLTELGYVTEDEVTEHGKRLQRIYGELDLVAAESLRRGVFENLDPDEFIGALSGLTFEARRPEDLATPQFASARARLAGEEMNRIARDIYQVERKHRLSYARTLDFSFAFAAQRWAQGADLAEIIELTDLAAGDFVRAMRQLLDLAHQISDAAGDSPVRDTARRGANAVLRGIIAYSAL